MESGDLNLMSDSTSYSLGDLGQVTWLLCASVSSLERIETIIFQRVVVRTKRVNTANVLFHFSVSTNFLRKLENVVVKGFDGGI